MKKAPRPFKLSGVVLILLVLSVGAILILTRHTFLRTDISKPTLADLKFIHFGMTIAEIEAKLGSSQLRTTQMYEYQISDNRKVILRVDSRYRVRGIWILNQDGSRSDFFTEAPLPAITLMQFDFLKRYIPYKEVIERVGEPNYEGGSGIHSAGYNLEDGRIVSLLLGSQQKGNELVEVVLGAWVSSEDNKLIDLFR